MDAGLRIIQTGQSSVYGILGGPIGIISVNSLVLTVAPTVVPAVGKWGENH